MEFFIWILFGLIVGFIAFLLDPHVSLSNTAQTMLLGIIGALVGGIIVNNLFQLDINGLTLTTLSVSMAGSLTFLLLGKALKKT